MKIADLVISINGRDAGRQFTIIGISDEYSLIADGKRRRIEKPKRKKNKHLKLTGSLDGLISEKLIRGDKITNNELRRALAALETDNDSSKHDKGGVPQCQKKT
ncbi:MAG: KOW domain-containing RNA-binding protein [Oscillospiraceae bacterium]|nr:KOW domain-containing RNA-binding protein [Oscillospiraceae bacterium]